LIGLILGGKTTDKERRINAANQKKEGGKERALSSFTVGTNARIGKRQRGTCDKGIKGGPPRRKNGCLSRQKRSRNEESRKKGWVGSGTKKRRQRGDES